jgi:L-seryl-tRNA(Ser) seleniumtransferase
VTDRRRALPSVDRLLRDPEVAGLLEQLPRGVVLEAVRESLAAARTRRAGAPESWGAEIRERLAARSRPSLRPVCNATGVVLHTNLGRAPLAPSAIAAVAAARDRVRRAVMTLISFRHHVAGAVPADRAPDSNRPARGRRKR